MVPFSFADEELALVEGRALYWPRERALLVADLHLAKKLDFSRCRSATSKARSRGQ